MEAFVSSPTRPSGSPTWAERPWYSHPSISNNNPTIVARISRSELESASATGDSLAILSTLGSQMCARSPGEAERGPLPPERQICRWPFLGVGAVSSFWIRVLFLDTGLRHQKLCSIAEGLDDTDERGCARSR